MEKKLDLKDIVLIGRTFDEYYRMFDLGSINPGNVSILDVASGVSSFCRAANSKGYNVTASDRIYSLPADEIQEKCGRDLEMVMKQIPGLAHMYVWDYFRDVLALRNQRELAYRLFVEDFRIHGNQRYLPVNYPETDFQDNQFNISLVSHLLFVYDDRLDYNFHKRTLQELLRITSKEIRIFPLVRLNGERSSFVDKLMIDRDFNRYKILIRKVEYEFMKNGNEMMQIEKK